MRLIDADELKIDYGFTWDDITPTHDEMYALIDRQPTIEPERKKGRWTLQDGYRCSVCNYKLQTTGLPTYCPNCGCEMRQEGGRP